MMDRTKGPALLTVPEKMKPSFPNRGNYMPSSSSSVKLPYLDTGQQLVTTGRPNISHLLSHTNGRSSSRNISTENNKANWDDHRTHLNDSTYLKNALEQSFGLDAPNRARQQYEKPMGSRDFSKPTLLQEIMASRNKNHSEKQEDRIKSLSMLTQERHRLLAEQEKLQERRRHFMAVSPAFSYAGHSSTDVPDWRSVDGHLSLGHPETAGDITAFESFIRDTERNLPAETARYNRLREQHLDNIQRLKRPYNGELGPQSFEAWQMDDYYMVRGLVEEVVDKFLDSIFRTKPATDTEHAVILADKREWDRRRKALDQSSAVQLLMEELILEGTRGIAYEVAEEFVDLNAFLKSKTNEMFLHKVEEVAMDNKDGRQAKDPVYNLVTKAFKGHISDRNKYRPEVWGHRQHLHLRGQERVFDNEDSDDESVEILHFHDIVPLDLRQIEPRAGESYKQRRKKDKFLRFMRREVFYWKSMAVSIQDFTMSAKCLGAYTVDVSPNNRFMAVGTAHGDVLVIDLLKDPLVPLRVIHNTSASHDAVMDIGWSLNSKQIVTINQTGLLQLWSMNSGGVLKADNKGLKLKADKTGVFPEQLSQNLVLDADNDDFMFQSGALADNGAITESQAPIKAAFYPTLTLMGAQNVITVVLENGDILRCDFEQRLYGGDAEAGQPYIGATTVKHPTLDNEAQLNLLGQHIPAELFRRHKHPVVFMGFVDHVGDMVTVDQKGYINQWQYSREKLSTYDWYVPKRTCRLDMSKTMYTPTSNAKPNIIFTDRLKGGKHKRTRQQLHQERMKVEQKLSSLDLGDPWHQEIIQEQLLITQVFAPREKIPESGSIFHVVIRHATTEQLSTYLTRLYKPVKVLSTKFLCCTQTPDGAALIFLLLFPEFPPKEAHISVVVLDVHNMDLRNWRRDIDIEDNELYQEILENDRVSCCVSKMCGTTGSAYLFVNVAGNLSVYSLSTGLKVLRTEDPNAPIEDGFDGCRLSTRGFGMASSAQLCVAGIESRIFLMAYTAEQSSRSTQNPNVIHLMEIKDENTEEERAMMRKSYQMWKANQTLPRSEMRVDAVSNLLDDVQPIEVFVRGVIMQLVDDIIQRKTQSYTAEQEGVFNDLDRYRHYEELLPQWRDSRTTPPPTHPSRQSSFNAPPTRDRSRPYSKASVAASQSPSRN